MVEVIGVGIGLIGILQTANLWQSRNLANKIDQMVTEDLCEERREDGKKLCTERCHEIKRRIGLVDDKVNAHTHNGNGVKFIPRRKGDFGG
jgi:hypothetical protein